MEKDAMFSSHESGFMKRLLLAQSAVDYDVDRRGEEGLIEHLLADDATKVLLVNNGLLAVPKRSADVSPGALDCAYDPAAPRPDASAPAGAMRLALLDSKEVRSELDEPGWLFVFLGTDRTVDPPVSYVALDITRATNGPRRGRTSVDREFGCQYDTFPSRALGAFDWVELRSFAPCASARDAGLATSAVAVSMWQNMQRYCPACGAPVRPALAGWAQTCTNDDDDGNRLLFPRIEPAVITAIVDSQDRLLLQHNTAWRPAFHSVSAGFVEAGESLERTVRRETMEEVGIELGEVRYLGSQPWPFPASIMLGFRARALSSDIRVDHEEVGAARWFTREELTCAVASGELELPGRASIARHMIEDWFGGRLEEPRAS